VAPLFGEALRDKTVGIAGDERTLEIALLLARSGVTRFAPGAGTRSLRSRLHRQNPIEDRYAFVPASEADVFISGPGAPAVESGKAPAVRLACFQPGVPVRSRVDVLPARSQIRSVSGHWPEDPFDVADALNRAAAIARAVLLAGSRHETSEGRFFLKPFSRPAILVGHSRWPWWIRAFEGEVADQFAAETGPGDSPRARPAAPASRSGRVLVVGCGSLGSVAALRLAPFVKEMVLCDPDSVGIENPIRQAFSVEDLGTSKATALARGLRAQGVRSEGVVRAETEDDAGIQSFHRLLDRVDPDLVILTTGTAVEYALAEALRERGTRHVAARCYARARYFEIIAVDGRKGPCFHCLRDQVHTGPAPSLTPEQATRYDPDYRPGELNAEPATMLESGRCADVLARVAAGFLQPPAHRPQWLTTTLVQERTCFLGGNHAECDARGQWAYGLDAPGKVTTYGSEDLLGARPGDRCAACGRDLAAKVHGQQ
jgi:molybdopterin/thiamine biosynthesis adenylyltransferase